MRRILAQIFNGLLLTAALAGCVSSAPEGDEFLTWPTGVAPIVGLPADKSHIYAVVDTRDAFFDREGEEIMTIVLEGSSPNFHLDEDTFEVLAIGDSGGRMDYVHPSTFYLEGNEAMLPFLAWQFAGHSLSSGPWVVQGSGVGLQAENGRITYSTTSEGYEISLRFTPSSQVWPKLIEVKRGGEWEQVWGFEENVPTQFHLGMARTVPVFQDVPNLKPGKMPETSSFPVSLIDTIDRLALTNLAFGQFLSENPEWVVTDISFQDLPENGWSRYEWEFSLGVPGNGRIVSVIVMHSAVLGVFLIEESSVQETDFADVEVPKKYGSLPLSEIVAYCDGLPQVMGNQVTFSARAATSVEGGGFVSPSVEVVAHCAAEENSTPEEGYYIDGRDGRLVAIVGHPPYFL